jgi:hypothetical protein
MFITADTAALAARMLRARVRIQSQHDADKLRAMLVELNDPDESPIYTQVCLAQLRAKLVGMTFKDYLDTL